ncbi:hypothetical protein [Antrihabitans cavernicola]|uniref:DUF559 domain-containing protein n=1 Tax=Antrihabitans cavernicola TaxID=2495913 RepID=A0A5A7SCM6_9NOCA|nr:hypothetical protein [Spelaeibacter cavernicola]KAA0021951.1 hypothetical protein FOY51_16315 [Spelaeibacter cavernicola]
MRRGRWAELGDLAAVVGTGGVIRVAELEGLGVARSTISARCQPGGPWRRVLPGVISLFTGYLTARQRSIAAVVYAGPGAMLSGRAALAEYGVGRHSGDVQVLVSAGRRVQSAGFVVIERTTRMPDAVDRAGIPCAPITRSVLDAARRCTTVDSARALIADIVQRGAASPRDLSTELEQGSGRGSALPRTVLREVLANVHSAPEAAARTLWMRSGLPAMVFNVDVVDADSRFIARPDGWIDAVALAWEIDSFEWHLSPASYQETVQRRNAMQSLGIVVLSSIPRTLKDEPDRVIADLRAHFALASSRPRPSVRIHPVRSR